MWGLGIGTGLTTVAGLATSAETAPVVVEDVVVDAAVVDSAEAELAVVSTFEVFSALQPTIATTMTQSNEAERLRMILINYSSLRKRGPLGAFPYPSIENA
jgi:hypothetical protein